MLKLTPEALQKYNLQRPKNSTYQGCWAAHRSMYLGLRGNVSACCYNKTYFIGKYPYQTLEEIWFGEKRKQLNRELKKYNFELGCHGCHELIVSGNFKGLPAKNFDFLPDADAGYPTKMDFELSNECNLECIMCRGEFSSAIRKNREKLPKIPTPYGEDLVEQLKPFIPHLKNCHFLGGEPFLIPIYMNIWETMNRLNPTINISIQTNGTILSERIKRILDSMPFDISISLDSLEKENYEKIRKNGKFEKLMKNLEYFSSYCQRKNTNFHLSFCPMPQNWHELPNFVHFANSKKSKLFFNTVYYPLSCSFQSLSKQELDSIVSQLENQNLPRNNDFERFNALAYDQVVQLIEYWSAETVLLKHDTFNSYRNNLLEYIQSQQPEQDAVSLFDEIWSKLDFVLKTAEIKGRKLEAEKLLMTVSYKAIYENVPTMTREHTLHLFKSFIMPINE